MNTSGRITLAGIFSVFTLTACIDIDGGSTDSISDISNQAGNNIQASEAPVIVNAAGIKGPLAHADMKIYAFDPTFPEMYDRHSPIALAITDQFAQVSSLSVPGDTEPPYILTIGGSQAIDLNTGMRPVIETLTTVITSKMLASNKTVYATPLTTLAYQMVRSEAVSNTDSTAFEQSVERAGDVVSEKFALDQGHIIDIFGSPVIINERTDTLAEQEEAVYHRAALEAFAANVYQMSLMKGNGLQATYFNDSTLSEIVVKRVDAKVDFDWGHDSPVQGVAQDGFSVRWAGLVMPDYSENYTFHVSTDDGVRLWVDGQLVIDNWRHQSETERSSTIQLVGGEKYSIVMEYYEYIGEAAAKLMWSSASEPKGVIPKSNLFNSPDATELAELSTDQIIQRIGLDLQSDGVINNAANSMDIGGVDPEEFDEDPRELVIPNTNLKVADTVALMSDERVLLGTSGDTDILVDSGSLGGAVGEPAQVQTPTTISRPALEEPVQIIIEPQPEEPAYVAAADTLILDNDKSGTSSTGTWKVSSAANPYGSNSYYSDRSGDTYTYKFNLAAPGEYQVFARWTEWSNRRTSVPYDISHLGGTSTVNVNQRQNGGQWNQLGSIWSFGSTATIKLRSLGNGITNADAIKLVPVSENQVQTPIIISKPVLSVSADSIDFGAIDVGSISSASALELTNSGSADMMIDDISFSSGYIGSDNCNNYLSAGESCTISISYMPALSDVTNGQLVIAGSAENAPYTVQLTGKGKNIVQPTTPSASSARYLDEDFEHANWADKFGTVGKGNSLFRESGVAARTGAYGIRINVAKGQHWGGRMLFDHSRHGQKGNFEEIWTRYYIRFGPNWRRDDGRMGKAGFRARSDENCKAPCLEMTDSHHLDSSGAIKSHSYFHRNVTDSDIENRTFLYKKRSWTGGLREREQWYCVETHHKLNTPGKGNGIYQNWLDGVLVSDQQNIAQRNTATFNIDSSVLIAYIGGDWVADHEMNVYFDDWAVSDKRIGCD